MADCGIMHTRYEYASRAYSPGQFTHNILFLRIDKYDFMCYTNYRKKKGNKKMLKIENIHKAHTVEFGDLKNGDIFEYQTDDGVCLYYMRIEDAIANSKSRINAIYLETGLPAHFDSYECVMPIHEATLTIER